MTVSVSPNGVSFDLGAIPRDGERQLLDNGQLLLREPTVFVNLSTVDGYSMEIGPTLPCPNKAPQNVLLNSPPGTLSGLADAQPVSSAYYLSLNSELSRSTLSPRRNCGSFQDQARCGASEIVAAHRSNRAPPAP